MSTISKRNRRPHAGLRRVDEAPASAGDRAPLRGQLFGTAQRESEDRIGRVRSAGSREDAGPSQVEVRDLVGLAVTIDH